MYRPSSDGILLRYNAIVQFYVHGLKFVSKAYQLAQYARCKYCLKYFVLIYYITLNIAWQNWYFFLLNHHCPIVYSLAFNKHYDFRLLVTRSWGCMVLPLSWSCWINAKWQHFFTIMYLWYVWQLSMSTCASLPYLYFSQHLVTPCISIDTYEQLIV